MNKTTPKGYLTEHICPICKIKFIPAPFHVYKEHGKRGSFVCSYKCDVESKRRADERKAKAKERYINRRKGVKEQ